MLARTVTIVLEISERMRQVTMRLLFPRFVGFFEIILIFWRTLAPCFVSVSLCSMVARDSDKRLSGEQERRSGVEKETINARAGVDPGSSVSRPVRGAEGCIMQIF